MAPKTTKAPPKGSLQARLKSSDQATKRKAVKQATANPAWRKYLPTSAVPPKVAAQRALNARLDTPITAGSSTTERQLARTTKAEAAVKYGPLEQQQRQTLAEAQQQQRDVGSYYDQYLAQIAQHAQNVGQIQQQAVGQVQGTQAGVTGLAASGLQGIMSQADKDAAARGETAGSQTQLANQATAVRQALVGSFVAQQAAKGAATTDYADALAHVVAPTQKLSAVAQQIGRVREARQAQEATAREKAAYDAAQRGEARTAEAKNVLAQSIAAGGQELKKQTLKETVRSHKAGETLTATKIATDATQKAADRASKAATAAAKAHEPNKYGVPADQWAKWSTSHRQRAIDKFNTKTKKPTDPATQSAKDFYAKYGIKPASTDAIRNMRNTISKGQGSIRTVLGQLKGTPSRAQVIQYLTQGHPKTKDEPFTWPTVDPLTAAVVAADYWQFGGITGGTAIRLHQAGYSTATLGVKNRPASSPKAAKSIPLIGGAVK